MVVQIITDVMQHYTYFPYFGKPLIYLLTMVSVYQEVVYDLNATEKRFIFQLMATVQLPFIEQFYTQMAVHTSTQNTYASLAQEFQNHLSNASHKHSILDNRKNKKSR